MLLRRTPSSIVLAVALVSTSIPGPGGIVLVGEHRTITLPAKLLAAGIIPNQKTTVGVYRMRQDSS